MKKNNYTITQHHFISLFLFCILCGLSNTIKAQWNLTGNNNATNTSILGTTNAVPLRLFTKNTQRLTIDTLGRVGIGTSTPVSLLAVKGAGSTPAASWVNAGAPIFTGFGEQTIGNADFILSMASSAANARPVFIGRRGKGTLAAPLAVTSNDHLMSFLSSGYDGTAFQNPAAIDFFVDGTPTAGNVPARISFVTGSNGSNRAERLKIGNTGDITINTNQLFVQKTTGNIGIGTITPIAKLDVSGLIKISGGDPGVGKVLTSDANGLASWTTPGSSSPWQTTGNNISNTNTGIVKVLKELNVVGVGEDSSNIFVVGNSDLSHKILMFGGRKNDPNPFIGWNSGDPLRFASFTNGFSERMRIDSTGKVGIGTISPTALLSVNGGADKPGGGSWGTFSDARLKDNVKNYTDGLATIAKIKPVTYHYNTNSGFDTSPQYVGVIAQELKEIAPYMVSETIVENNKKYLKVDNSAMTYMLINAVKELSVKNEKLENTNNSLQKQIDELKAALLLLINQKTPLTTSK